MSLLIRSAFQTGGTGLGIDLKHEVGAMVRANFAWLAAVLCWMLPATFWAAEGDPPHPTRFEMLDNESAWQRLDAAQPALPMWARALVRTVPRTTAAMLDLDYLHRAENPVGAVLAGKLRWQVADALGCRYFRSMSASDLRRAGLSEQEIKALQTEADSSPTADRELAAMRFARQLTLAGHDVTDEQVQQLMELFGPEQVVAIVHTIALANFQNRIALALGLDEEPDGGVPPLAPRWDRQQLATLAAPPRPTIEPVIDLNSHPDWLPPPRWNLQATLDVTSRLEAQKKRHLRIPLPDASRIAALPPDARDQAERILWDRVSSGYQPEMTAAWFACNRPFKDESKLDRVFANSLFWVVTRENQCFY